MKDQDQERKTEEGDRENVVRQRWRLLVQVENFLEIPMIVFGFIWLALLVVELTKGLSPLLQNAVKLIWLLFIADFLIKLAVAPQKRRFLVRNWLTMIALVVPAFRVARIGRALRVLRISRAAGSLRLVRILGSMNRGLRTLRRTMRRRSFGYVVIATVMVAVVGALAMRALEGVDSGQFGRFATSLWWTLMVLITLPTGTWPETPEGRILSFLLALYGFAMFGYVTAVLASWFVGQDDEEDRRNREILRTVRALEKELVSLRAEMKTIRGKAD